MRTITATRCSAIALIAALVLTGHARAGARQGQAAPALQGFEVPIGSPGRVSMAAGASRVFIADSDTGLAAHAVTDGLPVWTAHQLSSSLAPVVAGDQLFVASGGRVHALDEATGREKWARDLGDATALVANGAGVVGAAGRVVRAWSADGMPAWDHTFEAEVSPGLLAVDDGLAYVGLADRMLTAVDVATGDVRWQAKLPTLPRAFGASGGRLFFGGVDQALHSYPRGGGRPWRFPRVDVIGAPAIDDRLVYAVLWDNTAQAFDRQNGVRKWRTALPARAVSGPWVLGDEVVVPLMSGAIASLARKTGILQPAPKADADGRPRDRLLAAAASATGDTVFEIILLENNSRVLVARPRVKS